MENSDRRAARAAKSGFSLVELMIVVGVIAILAGLMFPLAGSVRARAQRASCLNNLRQWSLALNLYLDENRGLFPAWEAGSPKGWYEKLPPYLDQPTMSDSPVFPGTGKKSMFLCPSDRGDGTEKGKYYSSYTLNTHISKTKGAVRLHEVKNPDRFVVFCETGHGGRAGIDLSSLGMVKGDSSAFRHAGSVCMTFADGHAASLPRASVWRPGLSREENYGGFQWNPENDDLDNSAPEEQ